ncbi:larval cuticle protein A2B-like [Diachasma alloeum]|uniref:larval cuticle protein A2B-like n=1 Tax=Diachasma alloeum TaxID=454923 RepID=UPI000738501B|nr:larval cuticle protein A2B-like [Diachasma alloeum]
MIAKFILVIGFSAAVSGGLLPAAPLALAPAVPVAPVLNPVHEYDPHPQYTYAYDVQDALTGDSKSQHETRNGDVVSGSYSLIEADGTRRIVEYTADPINGFNAVVHREPAVVKAVVPAVPHAVAPLAPAPALGFRF